MTTPYLPFFINKPSVNDAIQLVSVEVNSYPKNCNAFHHDQMSMGTEIKEGIMIMFSSGQGPEGHPNMEYVNQVTGQRFALVARPVNPTYESFYLFKDLEIDGLVTFKDAVYRSSPEFRYHDHDSQVLSYVHTALGAFVSPVYVAWKGQLLLKSIVQEKTIPEIAEIIQKASYWESSTEDYTDTAEAMKKLINQPE